MLTSFRSTAVCGAGLLFALAYAWTVVILLPEVAITSLLSDDAFYYFEIARNIVHGRGSTFDGFSPTNGYHPLWMLIVVAVYGVAGDALQTPVLIIMIINAAVTLASLVLVYRLMERYVAPGFGWIAVSVCLLPPILNAMTNGLETGILLMATIVLMWSRWHANWGMPEASAPANFAFGILLGIAFLCRLDSVFLAVAAGIVFLAVGYVERCTLTPVVRGAMAMAAGYSLLAAPFFVWNLLVFGHAMPISGSVKTTFPHLRPHLNLNDDLGYGAALLAAVIGLVTWDSVTQWRHSHNLGPVFRSPLALLTIACTLHFLHAFLFLDWGVYWWHFALYGLAFALVLSKVGHHITKRRPDLRRTLVPAACAAIIVTSVALEWRLLWSKGEQHAQWLRAAEWMNESTPTTAILGMNDAGLVGYFASRPVINLDGKANGSEYRDFVSREAIDEYLAKMRVTHLADVDAHYDDQGAAVVLIPRPGKPSVRIPLRREWEVYRSADSRDARWALDGSSKSTLVIWELPERSR